MTATAVLYANLVGAGALSLWTLMRFPKSGPLSIRWTLLWFLVAQCLLNVGPLIVARVIDLSHSVTLALAGVVLPTLYVWFLTTAWLIRLVASMLSRGPWGGHRADISRAGSWRRSGRGRFSVVAGETAAA